VKAFRRSPFSPGDLVAIHQHGSAPSVRGSFVARTRRFYILNKHSIDVDGVYHESVHDRVLVPTANVAAIEVSGR
jgi:hypothetical protein